MKRKYFTSKSGITLIALVISIIILLILAGITISALSGDNGILKRATEAKEKNIIGKVKETVDIALKSSLMDELGLSDNVSVESVLGKIQKEYNSTDIYAVKGNGLIIGTEGTTKFGASFLFPKETVNHNKGIRVDVDDNLNITDAVATEVENVDGALANIEINKANLNLNLIWENGTPKVTYEETTGADVTIQYMIGTEGELKNATGGVISEPTLKLGDTVFIIVSKDGKQKDGGSVLVIDETSPVITKFEIKGSTEDSITVEVTATDNESGLATTGTYTYYKDGTIDGTSTTENTHVYSSLTAGTYKLKVEVVDKAGNKASPEIDGSIEQTTGAGLYDSEGTMLASWDTLVNDYNLNVEKDYTSSNYNTNNTDGNSMYYVLKQNFNGKTGLTLIMPGSNQQTANVDNKLDIVNSYEVASINENLKVATTNNQISKIGNCAFYDCSSLTSVTIGNSVTRIGSSAFYKCSSLTSVTIPDSVTSIGSSAFYKCSSLTSVTIPDSVTSIGSYAFYSCSRLTSVTIPDSVTRIENQAFSSCSRLTSVTIGNSVTSIGEWTFSYCSSLTSVTIPDSVTSIGSKAFYSCSRLTSVTIGNSVTSIGSYAFRSCSRLTSVTIGNSVTSIGSSAFEDCISLTSVTIPDSVTSIGEWTFSSCSSLTSVTIPDSVTSIGSKAFYSCSRLTSIEVASNNTKYASVDGVLFDKNKTKIIKYPEAKTGDYTIPDSVTSIGSSAFEDCISLTSVTIGSGVRSIGEYAFYGCYNLSITIPYTVEEIYDKDVFYDCSNVYYENGEEYYFPSENDYY